MAEVITEDAVAESEVAQRTFSVSIVISGIRCLLTYVVLPFVTPLIGLASGVGPALGVAIGSVAIAANVVTIRRFWRADHKWKIPISVISGAVIGLLVVLLVIDVGDLLG